MDTATRSALGDAPLATAKLARAIIDRSERYTSDRARLATPADRTGDLAARAAFFTVADALKIAIPLGELRNRDALPARRPLRVADLGAGCGAMSLGLVATLDGIPLELHAIDRDAPALAIAATAIRELAQRRAAPVVVTTRVADVTAALPAPIDLAVIGNLLNELPADRALDLVRRAVAAIADDGAVIVVEPALREASRALHQIRDAILAAGAGHVFAPCTRRGAPCPALADPTDWCHEDRALELPPRTAALARLTHLRDSGMKFSYLVLRRQPRALVEPSTAPGVAWRIVSAPRPAKGKLELIGCSDAGRTPLRLLRRHRAAANRDVERADRGDVLVVDAVPGDDRVEITAATPVTRLEPSRRG